MISSILEFLATNTGPSTSLSRVPAGFLPRERLNKLAQAYLPIDALPPGLFLALDLPLSRPHPQPSDTRLPVELVDHILTFVRKIGRAHV